MRQAEDRWFIGFLRFLLNDRDVSRIVLFMQDFCALRDPWKYAELRTKNLEAPEDLLLNEATEMHPASVCDQPSIQAFASLKLTPRETEVLFWISRGKTNHEIGIILGAKTGTICKHVEHVLSKLNVENRTAAAVMAVETFRSVAETFERKSAASWSTVAGVIGTRLAELWLVASEICDALPLVA